MICGSPQIAGLDVDLAKVCPSALASSADANAEMTAQREWLRTSRDVCRTAA